MKEKKLWNIIKKFNTKSIFFRYMSTSIITLLVPLIVFTVCFALYCNYTISKEFNNYEKSANQKVSQMFDDVIADVDEFYFSLSNNEYVHKFLYSNQITQLQNQDLMSNLQNEINDRLLLSHDIGSVYIYNDALKYFKGSNQSNYLNYLIDKGWYNSLKNSNYNDYIILQEAKYTSNKEQSLVICKTVYFSKEFVGCFIFNIPMSAINNKFNSITNIDKILITDSNDNIVFCNNPDFLSGKQELIIQQHMKATVSKSAFGFNIYTSTLRDDYKKQLSFYIILIISLFLLFLICAILTSYISSKNIYKSIINIIGMLQQNETELYDSKKESEYDFIQKSILKMNVHKNDIEQELAEKLSLLKTAQIKALHAQINPHFLNNTLDLIGLLDVAENKKKTKLYNLIQLFSKYLKALNSTNEYIVPLKQELKYTKDYLDIQNIKYDNIFDVQINADDNVLNLCATKLMLQPIVENAIMHGILESKNGCGSIIIDAFRNNDFLIVNVKNTNNTIQPEKLRKLKSDLQENIPPESEHIGLLNVNQRLKLIFSDISSCDINCNYDENTTTFTISIPAQKYNLK